MKNTLSKLSLANKLTLVTLGLCVFGTFAILTLVYASIFQLHKNRSSNELNIHKSLIAKAFIGPLGDMDLNQIEDISNSYLSNNELDSIVALKVVDRNGSILFFKSHLLEINSSFEKPKNGTYINIAISDIKQNGEFLGKVYIAYATDKIMEKYQKLIWSIFLFSLFVLAFMSIWFHIFFKNLLTKPFNELLEHIKEIRNQNFEIKEYVSSSPEIQSIANALNFTSHLIKKRNDDLEHYTLNLEKMVKERTSELEEQAAKNLNVGRLVAAGELASGIAHEINNPLMVINGQVLKLKRLLKNTEMGSELEMPLYKISFMSERMVKIINGLKVISRDGQTDPMSSFSVHAMIEEIMLLIEIRLQSLNIQFKLDIDLTIEMAYGREVQISQVIVNLINNSIDAISTLEDKWIKLSIGHNGNRVEFKITDSGHGITKEIEEKIMQPFFTTKEVGKGTGLGLSISKSIVKDHGGELTLNRESLNTQFIFSIYKNKKENKAA